ncbi:Yip1 domain [Musa troglodytarum]|uniref:Protein YIP n=1 Tax=Musa troglodytarum TaxID=320322 RepID=A0A9E7FSV5_9LILI|nr:Yip1 domain [Musa troglodytarum]
MEEGYTSLPTSHLLGSVPVLKPLKLLVQAVIAEEKPSAGATLPANLQVFPPGNGGYIPPESPLGGEEQAANNWKGFCSLSSYTPYFDVDTDVVVSRIISSVYPMDDFSRKIDGSPDLYGPVWISATLVFMLAALGNYGTYLIQKRSEPNDWAACVVFGYAVAVPAAFYFLLQYFGLNANLVRLWCMWGYSLFIFIPASLFLVVPSEIFRWIIIILAGSASSWFVYLNLKVSTEGSDATPLVVSALALQFALALFIKIFFFS